MTAPTQDNTGTADVAKDQASQVAGVAQEHASAVASTAKDQAGQVVSDAKSHAQDLYGQTTDQLSTQAGEQTQRLAGNLRELADQLGTMSDAGERGTTAHTVVDEAARRSGHLASYLDGREPGQIVGDVTDFARRRPGAFILGAAVAGLVVGRLGRAVKDAPDTSTSNSAMPSTAGSASNAGVISGTGYDEAPTGITEQTAIKVPDAAAFPQ